MDEMPPRGASVLTQNSRAMEPLTAQMSDPTLVLFLVVELSLFLGFYLKLKLSK